MSHDPKKPDGKKPEPEKTEPRKYSKQMIVDFVDLMMLADQIVLEYKSRHEEGSTEFVEELGFNDRVHLASTLMGLQMRDAMTGDADVRRAAFERMKELEALRDAEEKAERGSPPAPQVVRLEPAKIEKSFSALAEENGVPNARARQFVKLLMTTPEGHQMLELMLHDVVHHQRQQRTDGGTRGG